MRISDRQMLDNTLHNLQVNQERLARSTERATSGLEVTTPSDDPDAYARSIDYQSKLTRLDGYENNLSQVQAALYSTDGTMQSMQGILTRLRELTIQAQGPTTDFDTTATEVENLRGELTQLMNQKFNSEYLFSGYSANAPFDNNNVFQGVNQLRAVEVSPLGATTFGVTAQDAFGVAPGQTAFAWVDQFITALRNRDRPALNSVLGALDSSQKQLAQAQTKIGSQLNGLQLAHSGNQAYRLSLTTSLSEARDADPAEAYSALVADKATVEATYTVLSIQRGLSLTKYL